MRVEASFSAVGLLVLLAMTDSEWRQTLLPRDAAAPAPASQAAACTSETSIVENVRHYDFYGSRPEAAGSSLRQRLLVSTDYQGREKRFTGQTDWHIEWRACFETRAAGCRISGVVSTVNVTYTLPRWVDHDAAPPAFQDRWNRYSRSLSAHEKGHGAIAVEVARMIEKELVGRHDSQGCEPLNAQSSRIVDEVMLRGEGMQREYDRVTAHGSTQGALFPF